MIKWQDLPWEENLYNCEKYYIVITPRHQVLIPHSYKEIENYHECAVYRTYNYALSWEKLEGEDWVKVDDEQVGCSLNKVDEIFWKKQNALGLEVNVDLLLKWKN